MLLSSFDAIDAQPAILGEPRRFNEQSWKAYRVPLIRDAGFDPVDAGALRIARYTEPFALIVAQVAYEATGVAI